jgi:hypothetical protein
VSDPVDAMKAAFERYAAGELMRSWREGFGDGLKMAEKMANRLLEEPGLGEAQRAVLLGLLAALGEAQKEFPGISPPVVDGDQP